jgi:hypothetical protein
MATEGQNKASFNGIIKSIFRQRKDEKFPKNDNPVSIQTGSTTRRELIKNLAVLPVVGAPLFEIVKKTGWNSFAEENLDRAAVNLSPQDMAASTNDLSKLKGKVPKGKIKNLEISRLIAGGNLISGFVYSRDLLYVSELMKRYFTNEKVIEILGLCEACGINTAILRCDDHIIGILKEYRKRGGKIQWIAQTYPKNDDISNIKIAVDNGAVGAFIQGGIADKMVADKRLDYIAKPIEYMRSQGLIAGTAGHELEVPKTCVENGILPDFFMKTFHHYDYWSAPSPDRKDKGCAWCKSPEEVAEFFKTCKIPWIAYKVMAAGAIKPESAFKFIFENGAEFANVGMFDFQIVQNANAAYSILNSNLNRERLWYT